MTRFARAKGSKASNERIEEKATSWAEMKEQLNAKKSEADDKKMQKEADTKRKQNYDKFIKEVEAEQTKSNEWADFPESISSKSVKVKQRAANGNPTKDTDDAAQTCDVNNVKIKAKKMKVLKSKGEVDINGNTDGKEGSTVIKKMKGKKRKETQKNSTAGGKKKMKNEVVMPKKTVEEMTEDERMRFEKSKEKKLKQLEKKKLKKQKLKEQIEMQKNDGNDAKKNFAPALQQKQAKAFHNKANIGQNLKAPSKAKKFDSNKEHKRRKPMNEAHKLTINGKEIDLVYFDGFPIKRADAERLTELRKQMISKGLPRSEVKKAMQLERRRAEKALARDKKSVCFNCRQAGHVLSECPAIGANVDTAASGICFKCGSTEHTQLACKVVKNQEFRFASCFICKEQGHISWQCPDNARGLYPKGGGCKLCGDVTHLKKDCPKHIAEQQAAAASVDSLEAGGNPDSLEPHIPKPAAAAPRSNKIVKF